MDPAAARAVCEAADPVTAFCGQKVLWGDLTDDPRLVAALRTAYDRVTAFVKNHQP